MDLFTPDLLGTCPQKGNFSKTRERGAGTYAREGNGGSIAELVRMVETMAARRCSVNQVLEAVRAFQVREATTPAQTVWISASAPEWRAWSAYWRETRGKTPPIDRRGGWRFPSKTPPAVETGPQP